MADMIDLQKPFESPFLNYPSGTLGSRLEKPFLLVFGPVLLQNCACSPEKHEEEAGTGIWFLLLQKL